MSHKKIISTDKGEFTEVHTVLLKPLAQQIIVETTMSHIVF